MASLVSRMKSSPDSYEDEFKSRFLRLEDTLNSFKTSIGRRNEELEELLNFVSLVIEHYRSYAASFSTEVVSLLRTNAASMHPEMRMCLLKCLMRITDKDLIPISNAFEVFFNLFRVQEKDLRVAIRSFLIHSVKRVNAKGKNVKLNTELQNYVHNLLEDKNSLLCREAVLLLVEMYRRQVWKNERTVNFIADALSAKCSQVMSTALNFFLGQDKKAVKDASDSDDDEVEDATKAKQLKVGHRVGRQTKKRDKRLKRSLERMKKRRKRHEDEEQRLQCNLSAIHMLYDPQKVAERLLKVAQTTQERFELRLKMLELIAKLIGAHRLLVLPFYALLQRFMRPQQRDSTHFLLFASHASHDQVPPDVIGPLVRTIADNFITERASSEAIAVGLNTVREMARRCPFAVEEDLLGDLIQYSSYRDKNVVAAARSLIRVYREINPSLLPRRYRGAPPKAEQQEEMVKNDEQEVAEEDNAVEDPTGLPLKVAKRYGQDVTMKHLPGAELLDVEADKITKDNDGWETCSEEEEDAESDGDWVDVSHSSDEADEEGNPKTKEHQLSAEEKISKAREVLMSRVLTEEDFDQLKKHEKKLKLKVLQANRKRKSGAGVDEAMLELEEEEEAETTAQGERLPTMSAIMKMVKRPKASKADRLESVMEGREDGKKYGYQVRRQNPHASTTNKEKRKKKPFLMVRQKVKSKDRNQTFQQKQKRLRERLKKVVRH